MFQLPETDPRIETHPARSVLPAEHEAVQPVWGSVPEIGSGGAPAVPPEESLLPLQLLVRTVDLGGAREGLRPEEAGVHVLPAAGRPQPPVQEAPQELRILQCQCPRRRLQRAYLYVRQ